MACLECSGNALLTIYVLPARTWAFPVDMLAIVARHANRWLYLSCNRFLYSRRGSFRDVECNSNYEPHLSLPSKMQLHWKKFT
ncbi:hypothetical protein BDQ17DRAFT_1354622 [Cyathus striatus]|nr:hypothetical protein BDQ17DRAFT_1354622 [Cyathus striatus]